MSALNTWVTDCVFVEAVTGKCHESVEQTVTLGLLNFPNKNILVASSRVNQEMKAAAAKFMEEEARVKADKEEKMTKFRVSGCDAAARTIQQMYYVFSVSTVLQCHETICCGC